MPVAQNNIILSLNKAIELASNIPFTFQNSIIGEHNIMRMEGEEQLHSY